jgi:hypothetical protein
MRLLHDSFGRPDAIAVYAEDGELLVRINLGTGEVDIPDEERLPEAARRFWEAVRLTAREKPWTTPSSRPSS